jgi:hypothetical protein
VLRNIVSHRIDPLHAACDLSIEALAADEADLRWALADAQAKAHAYRLMMRAALACLHDLIAERNRLKDSNRALWQRLSAPSLSPQKAA